MKLATGHPQELISALVLARASGTRLREHVQRVRELGSCVAAVDALDAIPTSAFESAERRLEATVNAGFGVVAFTDRLYPRLLRAAPDPPLALSVWGSLEPEDALSLAVVGSRRATHYGLEMSGHLSRELGEAGLTIVSGLARGIDAAAHRGALAAGARTLAVLGSGLRCIYPSEHRRLAETITSRGAVLSELDLYASPRPGNFPRRNRIITGMTLGTLVVEAALKSGSLVSARLALEQDREVFAVPGPARSENSEGVHALIRDGAKLVARVDDILDELRPDVRELLSRRTRSDVTEKEKLDEIETRILNELRKANAAIDLDSILEQVELPIDRALAALCGLEVKGYIWSPPGGLYQAKPR